jgi:bacterioferritin-associated ferredoxin
MIVCVCHRVSHKTIEQNAVAGASFEEIKAEHGVGTQCGQCEQAAHAIWSGACARRNFPPLACASPASSLASL